MLMNTAFQRIRFFEVKKIIVEVVICLPRIFTFFYVQNMEKTLQKIFFQIRLKRLGYTQNTNIKTSFAVVEQYAFDWRQLENPE